MKRGLIIGLVLALGGAGVAYASELVAEFNRRDAIRLSQEQGNAINFLKSLNYDVAKIVEVEAMGESGHFITRDRDDIICVGNPANSMLRCKNKAGISTVLYEGDAD